MALSGVDLVVELPAIASLSSSDYFATFAIKVAHYLDIDTIAFGSEINDISRLENVASNINSLEQSSYFQDLIKQGNSYAKIVHDLIDDQQVLRSPNNILGVAYIKAISNIAPTIKESLFNVNLPHITIKRLNMTISQVARLLDTLY